MDSTKSRHEFSQEMGKERKWCCKRLLKEERGGSGLFYIHTTQGVEFLEKGGLSLGWQKAP
jgi:hypothetical protein